MIVRENVVLAPYTSFSIGGPARYFVEATSVEEVQAALDFAREKALPVFVLGGGSNILISDNGFEGLALAIRIPGISPETLGDQMWVTAGAGVAWDDLVVWAIENNLAGLECLSGVPGTVGGAVVANIGCYGAQASDTFLSAEVVDREHLERGVQLLKKEKCDFSYHESVFGKHPGRYVVLRATFLLSAVQIDGHGVFINPYRDNRFDLGMLAQKIGREPMLTDVRTEVLTIREQKGQLASSYKSAGSFFHMPFVSADTYQQVLARAQALDAVQEERLRPWAWVQPDGSYKLAPGFLLEYTEFQKGYTRGMVGISPKHTLTIINLGRTHTSKIAQLAQDMHVAVEKTFGVNLEREVEYVGDV